MPPKKKAAKKKVPLASKASPNPKRPENSSHSSFLKSIAAIFILVFIVTISGFLAHMILPQKKHSPKNKPVTIVKRIPVAPVFEIYPKEEPDYHSPDPLDKKAEKARQEGDFGKMEVLMRLIEKLKYYTFVL